MKELNQLEINFLGDSITEGVGTTALEFCFVERVAARLGCKVNNYGICGTRIAPRRQPSDCPTFDEYFLQRALKMPDADLLFVFGGTNDYGHGDADFGTLTDESTDTFCGAFTSLANYLTNRYGKSKLCYILPLHRFNEDSSLGDGSRKIPTVSLKEYVNAERTILQQLGIAFLDLADIFPQPEVCTPTELFQDGLHPTNKGHKLIAEQICKYVRSIVL